MLILRVKYGLGGRSSLLCVCVCFLVLVSEARSCAGTEVWRGL